MKVYGKSQLKESVVNKNCRDLINRRTVDIKYIKNLNDFKLLQARWIFDINFAPTFEMIKARHYLEMIRQALPESKKIVRIFTIIQAYLNEKIMLFNINKKDIQ